MKKENNMIPAIAALVATTVLGKVVYDKYMEAIESDNMSEEEIASQVNIVQKNLVRLIDLNTLNQRFEQNEDVDEIRLSIDGVDIDTRIEELKQELSVLVALNAEFIKKRSAE